MRIYEIAPLSNLKRPQRSCCSSWYCSASHIIVTGIPSARSWRIAAGTAGLGDETDRRNHAGRCDSPSHPGRLRLGAAGELLTHATERSYTDAWMVRVAGAMDQRRLFNLSTTGPAKRVSPHWLHTSAGTLSNTTTLSCQVCTWRTRACVMT